MHLYEGQFWGMHWFWWILWVIFLIWIFATPWSVPGTRIKKETPLDILKKRYARGEIDKDEFFEIKNNLQK